MGKVLEASLLGLVQGLTEFLPISSSGHLFLFQELLGWEDPEANVTFSIALHFGSLLAVLVFVRREIRSMLGREPRLLLVVFVATLPIAVLGILLKDVVEGANAVLVGGCFLGTAAILAFVRRTEGGALTGATLPLPRALLVGLAQVLAVLPGVSRSGTTLAASLKAGMRREDAVRFAFLLAAPAILGAAILGAWKGKWDQEMHAGAVVAGISVSFVSSLLAMHVLVGVVQRRKLGWFALYCAVLGVLTLGTSLL